MQIIQVPYDSGHKGRGMGNGPERFVNQETSVLPHTHLDKVEVEELAFEFGTTFRVLSCLSDKVSAAVRDRRFPLVLAGGCISSVGTLAGLGSESTAVVWLDAHADFNTPETTITGFFDGMALATVTGRCWRHLASSVPGFRPVLEKNVVLIGARDLDLEERRLLESSAITWIETATIRSQGVAGAVREVLENLQVEQIYLHVDLDVLDAGEAHVNRYFSPGGVTLAELLEIVRVTCEARPLAAAAITAYDPSYDTDQRGLKAGTALLKEVSAICEGRLARTT